MRAGGTLLDDKRGRIRAIHDDGKQVIVEIIRHQLPDERAAFEVEAVVIDALTHCTRSDLKNKVRGHGHDARGWAGLDELRHLEAPKAEIPADLRPALLIRPNRKYRYGMDADSMWEATRGWWKMRRRDYRTAFCVHGGIVRGVWRVSGWDPDSDWRPGKRRALVGQPAEDLWPSYVGGWVGHLLPAKGGQVPFTVLT